MTYTKEQLEAMSDGEVNVDLHAKILGGDWVKYADVSDNLKSLCLHDAAGNPYFEDVPDYCNNWSNIMPLAVEHGIEYCKIGDGFIVSKNICSHLEFGLGIGLYNKSLQRAMAGLLLMMEI